MRSDGGRERYKAGFEPEEKYLETLGISAVPLGQHYPQHYPQAPDPLGEPLSIHQVAELLGCSDWTVRHALLPKGLPHLRSGRLGKLLFYRNQVVKWVLEQQRKGGM